MMQRTAPGCHSMMRLRLRLLRNLMHEQCMERNVWRIQRRFNSDCSTLTLENTFKCYELEKGPPTDVELSREDAVKLYRQMVEVRRLEVVSGNMYKAKQIRGFCHLYIGQEAVAVGMCASLRKQDSVITAYRAHAWTYLMGVTAHGMIGELVGVRSGCSRGKGGSMHTYADNFYGGNGIVGAQVPLGAGVALAHRYKGDGGVCVACYGDGAANQGQVFEAYNIAKLKCLPCIFVCENNHYGMGTHISRHAALTDFYMRGQYVPGLWVDGNQVLAVRSATQFAIEHALNNGPIVLEMNTYRYEGHSMSDPGLAYRTRKEVQEVRKQRDPIESFRKQILSLGLTDEAELKAIDVAVRKEMSAVSKKVVADREVGIDELAADIYAKNVEPKIRGVSGYNLTHKKIAEVCFGKPKPTPANEMKNVPIGDAALIAAQLEAKKKNDEKKAAEAKAKAKDVKPKKDDDDDDDDDPPAPPAAAAAAPPAAAPPAAAPPAAAPPAAAPPAAAPPAAAPPAAANPK
ncbi:pyruvate dehydrogenase E1 component subunit alpha, mitochondrial [Drosophila nasuta]|uniref:pyruvate dehydrogenase E1 component subunit alpha, mitochondrial n=1 Tax=Drosophila nasuta TaxID=42062 RepID=UPI00295E7655|nr:pyruvate dehydrogenase E1 component subunit alpha, mitochondrial [Drosophila nasuta]